MSNTFTKFIDSCVGAIARKVQDEFDESKHPRDKGGRFSSKGGEGRGAGASEYDGMDRKEMEQLRSEAMRKQEREQAGSDKFHAYQKQISELTKHINRAKKSEGGLLPETDFEKEAKKEIGSGKTSGSEGADEDEVPSLGQYYENVRENLDRDDNHSKDYGLEERYIRAKFHSEQFKKLKNGEFITEPDKERWLKNYYRRVGMKKPEDAFKVWWDI